MSQALSRGVRPLGSAPSFDRSVGGEGSDPLARAVMSSLRGSHARDGHKVPEAASGARITGSEGVRPLAPAPITQRKVHERGLTLRYLQCKKTLVQRQNLSDAMPVDGQATMAG